MLQLRMWNEQAQAMIYNQVLIYKTMAEQAAYNHPEYLHQVGERVGIRPIDYGAEYVYMLYTGVDDQNGNKIYVNDYVEIMHRFWQLTFLVIQERGAFVLHNPLLPNVKQFPDLSNYMSIRGNKFQDPAIQFVKPLK